MPGTTPIYGFPYPEATDLVADYPALGQQLAEDVETELAAVGGGLVHLHTETFTTVSSVSVNNIFTSTYANYRIVVNLTASSTNLALRARTRLAGSDDTGSNYYTSRYYIGTTGAGAGSAVGAADTAWVIFDASDSTSTNNHGSFDLYTPLASVRKQGTGLCSQQNPSAVGYGFTTYFNKIVTTNYDGLTLYTSTGTASGVLRIYGYQNA